MRPWLLTIGPLRIETEAREELMMGRDTRSPEEYLDWVWDQRPKTDAVSSKGWPSQIGKRVKITAANVTPITAKRPNAL